MDPVRKKRRRRKRRVEEPLTEELLEELLEASDPRAFADRHRLARRTLSGYLQQLLEEKGLERAEVVRRAGLNDTFGCQIFMGQRGASRNKVLQLAFAMGLSLREANRLLQAAGVNDSWAMPWPVLTVCPFCPLWPGRPWASRICRITLTSISTGATAAN